MPRVPVHDLDTAPEAAHNTLAALQHRFGRIINIHGEMAHSPVVLAAYTGIQAAIVEHGSFDGRTREAVALAIAAVDNCGYCQAVHTLAGQRAGLDLDQTVAIRAVQPVEPKLEDRKSVV